MLNDTRNSEARWEGIQVSNMLGVGPHRDFDNPDLWVISGREEYDAAMGSTEEMIALARAIIENMAHRGTTAYEPGDLDLSPPTDDPGGHVIAAPSTLERARAMDLCLSENARRLVGKLVDLGVEFTGRSVDTLQRTLIRRRQDALQTMFIRRDHGQGMMNMAHGEIAPTWHLAANAAHVLGRVHSWSGGEYPLLQYGDAEYVGVNSYMPLTWILRQLLKEWSFNRAEDSDALAITVRNDPPHW